jgi:hypothetical protein
VLYGYVITIPPELLIQDLKKGVILKCTEPHRQKAQESRASRWKVTWSSESK